ncbi:MAG: DUF721 domain-containing protein [Chthonomonadaceae bacterium]|nr:DUF721 domain-containing protein [Chthonomonadaceae bacterium]
MPRDMTSRPSLSPLFRERRPTNRDEERSGFKASDPNPMASSLVKAIGGMANPALIRESLALAYWARTVGEQAAAATEASHVRDGVLYVRTKSSTWSHELQLHKATLILNLNRLLGGRIIRDIMFRAQGIERKAPPPPEENPTEEAIMAVILEPAEKDELRKRLEGLIRIEDDHARTALARRITLDMKLRHWRLENGWKLCPRCGSTHKTPQNLCPICRLEG